MDVVAGHRIDAIEDAAHVIQWLPTEFGLRVFETCVIPGLLGPGTMEPFTCPLARSSSSGVRPSRAKDWSSLTHTSITVSAFDGKHPV